MVDLGGDVRANPKLSGTKHNVFGIQTGVAITFMVKHRTKVREKPPAHIRYIRRPEMEIAEDKLAYLANKSLSQMKLETITPSKRGNWINQIENEWDDLLPIADKKVKTNRRLDGGPGGFGCGRAAAEKYAEKRYRISKKYFYNFGQKKLVFGT